MGKFYIEIDRNFAEKESRPDNVYRFVERFEKSNHSLDQLMTYGKDKNIVETRILQFNVQKCTEIVEIEVTQLKEQLKSSRKQLHFARYALCDVTN